MGKVHPLAALAVDVAGGWVDLHALHPNPRITYRYRPGAAIVCFRDTLTAGTGAEPGASHPTQLVRLRGRPVIKAGMPGDTTASALAPLPQDVLAHAPPMVCSTLGGDDLKNGVSCEEIFANLENIVEPIYAAGAMVVQVGFHLPVVGPGLREGWRDLAKRTGGVLIPNLDTGLLGRPQFMSDAVHPDGRGYELLAHRVHRAIQPHLA